MVTRTDVRASIRVRFHGPTDTKSARYSVTDGAHPGMECRRLYVPVSYQESDEDDRALAAQAFLDKYINAAWVERGIDAFVKVVGPGLAFEGDTFFTWASHDRS